jgi:hypothetical protein
MIAPRAEITPASTPRHCFFSSGAPALTFLRVFQTGVNGVPNLRA